MKIASNASSDNRRDPAIQRPTINKPTTDTVKALGNEMHVSFLNILPFFGFGLFPTLAAQYVRLGPRFNNWIGNHEGAW